MHFQPKSFFTGHVFLTDTLDGTRRKMSEFKKRKSSLLQIFTLQISGGGSLSDSWIKSLSILVTLPAAASILRQSKEPAPLLSILKTPRVQLRLYIKIILIQCNSFC